MDWTDKYEQMGQLFRKLENKIDVLAEENQQLLDKCQQLEVHHRMESLNLKCEIVPAGALWEELPTQETNITSTRHRSLNGDVYNQLDECEHSLDMKLEDLKNPGFISVSEKGNDSGASQTGDLEQTCTSCLDFSVVETSCKIGTMTPGQDIIPKRSKRSPIASSTHPLEPVQRAIQAQEDVVVPDLTTSDSMFSFSSDDSVSQSSTADHLGVTPITNMTKISLRLNDDWDVID